MTLAAIVGLSSLIWIADLGPGVFCKAEIFGAKRCVGRLKIVTSNPVSKYLLLSDLAANAPGQGGERCSFNNEQDPQ